MCWIVAEATRPRRVWNEVDGTVYFNSLLAHNIVVPYVLIAIVSITTHYENHCVKPRAQSTMSVCLPGLGLEGSSQGVGIPETVRSAVKKAPTEKKTFIST